MLARATSASMGLILLLTSGQLWGRAIASPSSAPQAAEPLCYQAQSGSSSSPTIEQLRLQRNGQRITGTYNWIPWQKDRRLGRLDGREAPVGTARLTYRFSQEGQQSTAMLTVVFDARQATIRWDPSGSEGQALPPVRLPRRACAVLKPVTGLGAQL
jgi:hypothetical protein